MSAIVPPGRFTPLAHDSAPFREPIARGASPRPDGEPTAKTVNLKDVLAVVRRHWRFVLAVTIATTALAGLWIYSRAPRYRAAAVIRLVDSRSAMTGGLDDQAMERMMGGPMVDPLLSQVQVMRSRSVLGEVVDREGLRLVFGARALPNGILTDVSVDPATELDALTLDFAPDGVTAQGGGQTVRAAYGAPISLDGVEFSVAARPEELQRATLFVVPREAGAAALLQQLGVRVRDRTNVIDIEYTDTDPVLARRVVNGITAVFQDFDARISQQQSRRRRVFIEEQLAQTDSLLAEAQLALSNFRSREAVYSSRERFAAQQEGLLQLETRQAELEADRQMYEVMVQSLEGGSSTGRELQALLSSPDLGSNPIVQGLYLQLAEYRAARDSLTAGGFGRAARSPEVVRVESLIESTQDELLEAVHSHLDALDARITALRDLQARSAAEIRTLPGTESIEVRLLHQVETVRMMADQLREEYQKAKISEAVQAGQVEVIDEALLPTRPIGVPRPVMVMVGLAFGLLLGGGGAFLLEHVNTSIRRRDELEEHLRVPGLAVIPQFASRTLSDRTSLMRLPGATTNGKKAVGGGKDLVLLTEAQTPSAEAYRTLRTNLIFSQSVRALKTLVVTSATPGEGKTTTIANLAVSFAQQGKRVLLVDCDLRRPRLHNVFGVPKEPGLTQFVLGHLSAEEAIRPTAVDGLYVMTSGTLPPNPSEFLGGAALWSELETLFPDFDLVLLDAPPVLAASDAAILGTRTDGVVFVLRAGTTDRAEARHAVQQLTGVGARVVGAVLNDPDSKVPRSGEGGYYAYSYNGDGHTRN